MRCCITPGKLDFTGRRRMRGFRANKDAGLITAMQLALVFVTVSASNVTTLWLAVKDADDG